MISIISQTISVIDYMDASSQEPGASLTSWGCCGAGPALAFVQNAVRQKVEAELTVVLYTVIVFDTAYPA